MNRQTNHKSQLETNKTQSEIIERQEIEIEDLVFMVIEAIENKPRKSRDYTHKKIMIFEREKLRMNMRRLKSMKQLIQDNAYQKKKIRQQNMEMKDLVQKITEAQEKNEEKSNRRHHKHDNTE